MQMTNKTQRYLTRKPTAAQPSPNGTSAETQRHLSRGAYGISAVTTRYLSRERTAEMPLKVGFFRLDIKGWVFFRFDFAGLTYSMEQQTSCVPAERDESFLAVYVVKDRKTKRGLMV